jgi:hypothetical protein
MCVHISAYVCVYVYTYPEYICRLLKLRPHALTDFNGFRIIDSRFLTDFNGFPSSNVVDEIVSQKWLSHFQSFVK